MAALTVDERTRFQNLGFEDFRRLAANPELSLHEKIGFPNDYRAGKADAILADLHYKAPRLGEHARTIVDIGPGCGELALRLIELCQAHGHTLVLIDSAEVLAQLPDGAPGRGVIHKIAGFFPDCVDALAPWLGKADALLCYSVFHYVFAETNLHRFFDTSLRLLAGGGRAVLGDIPNASMRARFFASPSGIAFHREFTGDTGRPPKVALGPEAAPIDDAVLVGLLLRARSMGFHSYLMPQDPSLPFANRREDLVLGRP